MARCPKCSNRTNVLNTLILSKKSKRFLCNECKTVLEVNTGSIAAFWGISNAILIISARYNGKSF